MRGSGRIEAEIAPVSEPGPGVPGESLRANSLGAGLKPMGVGLPRAPWRLH